MRLRSLREWLPTRPDYLYSFWVALAYVIIAAWAVPMLFRRLG